MSSQLGKRPSTNFQPHLAPDEHTTVDDLTVTALVDGYLLEWSYKNFGDYSQDGEVNLADLAILGRFLFTPKDSPEWPLARRADGNGDGEVNINDVSPLAQNWRGAVGGYLIAPDLGDGDGNGLIGISDLGPIGYLLRYPENGALPLQPRSSDQGLLRFGGPEGDDFNTTVEPGSPGVAGPWEGFGMYPGRLGNIDADGRKRFSYRLHDAVLTSAFIGWTILVAPVFDDGDRTTSRVYWDWSTVGEPSNIVTLPELAQ